MLSRKYLRPFIAGVILLMSVAFVGTDSPIRAIWPSIVALSSVVLLKSVLPGLLLGAFSGALIAADANVFQAFIDIFKKYMIPALQSSWNISIIIFTLLMGGFVALIEAGGGITGILNSLHKQTDIMRKRTQLSAFFMGLICFFDGLASSMLVGRVMKPVAARSKVSGVKLAYIVDSTSSPIACIAVVSTWIAYQLSMIKEGLPATIKTSPYLLFIESIPQNYYCIFTLVFVFMVIIMNINFGPMKRFEDSAYSITTQNKPTPQTGHWCKAAIPLLFLILSMLIGLYISGHGFKLPASFQDIYEAFGKSDAALVLVCASALSCILAFLFNPFTTSTSGEKISSGTNFMSGMTSLFIPVLILVSAWTLSAVLKELKTVEALTSILTGSVSPYYLPAAIFITGALISFVTGSSWGTMGVLMPIALPLLFTLGSDLSPAELRPLIPAIIASVLGGAVFGDHCSPMSDTTIVSAIACGVAPLDHVKTQLPYALLTAVAALITGYLPAAIGIPVIVIIPLGTVILIISGYTIGKIRINSKNNAAPSPDAATAE
jgi:Na+/H+ antiporter NhaC